MKQQKLVTIRLEVVMGGSRTESQIQEHLPDYLDAGWTIASVTPAAPGSCKSTVAWFAVVLEKGEWNRETEK